MTKDNLNTACPSDRCVIIIKRKKHPWSLSWSELVEYRDLFRFLIWRQIKVRYAQSVLGIGWAVIQPLFTMLVFTIVFGRIAKIDSEGSPYALFSLAALLPWNYCSNAVSEAVGGMTSEANMLRKIYFPRLFLPLSTVVAKLLDLAIAFIMMAVLMAYYGQCPSYRLAFLPFVIILMVLTASACSLWLAALAVQYRDIKHGMAFAVQLAMYASPIVYPTALIPESYHFLYSLNPMVGIVESFRSMLLNSNPFPTSLLGVGFCTTSALLITGLMFFNAKEKIFADVA